jgi:hypothetical protein
MEIGETWGYVSQEVVLQGSILEFVWVGCVGKLGDLENPITIDSG